jgi:conjugative relaxase-like TrwC/TraI family protein
MRPLNISPSQAKDYYYEVDPFFSPNKESENPAGYYQSMWHGRVSSMMGIEHKEIQKTDFVNIISGNDLKGTKIIQDGKDNDGNLHHRAAIDIPFSAPKSVSLCALHVGDQDLINAHTKAVEETVKYIEDNYLYIRFTTDKTRPVQNPNGLFATFNHSTSRSNDPQLHTHTLIMNMSFSDLVNGWRATWNDKIFDDQKHLTMVYQNALAKNVKDLGYEVEKRPNGFWEIAGVKQEWIDTFSKRKSDIDEKEDELKQKVFSGNDSVLRNIAVLETRADKNPFISKEELKTLWEKQVSKDIIKENVEKIKTENSEKTRLTPEEYLRMAYKTINENESTFRKYDVIDTAISLSIGDYSPEQFESKYNEMVRKNEIIKIAESVNSRGLVSEVYTSYFILETEQEIIKHFVNGMNNSPAIHNKQSIENHILNTYSHFTDGQKNALIQSLTTRDQYMVIQGDAGTGKTSLMKAIKEIIDTDQINFDVKGLGFTGKAADELEKKSGIESQTITGFLHQKGGEGTDQNTLYIVDESSMVGSVQMLDLINRAQKDGAKIIFVGDGKQLQAISAGKTFKVLSESFKAELMEEAIRQKTEYMIDTVRHIKNFQTGKDLDGIEKAFDTLQMNGRVFEIKDQGKRINHVIKDYLSDHDYTRNIIVTPKNDDRKKINSHMVKVIAKDSNETRNTVETEIRLPVSLIGEARLHANSYTVGHKAFLNGYGVNACIDAGTILENVRADRDKITVTYKGQTYDLDFKNTSKDLSVFQKLEPRSLETTHEFKPLEHYYIQSETTRGVFEVVKADNDGVTFSQNKKEMYLSHDQINKTDLFKRSGTIHDVALGDLERCVCVAEQNIDTGSSLKIGQEMTITGKNTITNTIDVEHKEKTFTLDLNENGHMMSVYEAEKRIFAEGEKVVLLKNDTQQEIQNGLTGVIERIDKFGNIKAVNDDRDIYFNVHTYPYVDHGYAVTVHKSQGQDARKVYIVSDTEYKGLNNTEVFNVGITRGQVDAFLYVDNAALFKEQVKGEQGKTSTLDHMKIDLSKSNPSKDEGKGIE